MKSLINSTKLNLTEMEQSIKGFFEFDQDPLYSCIYSKAPVFGKKLQLTEMEKSIKGFFEFDQDPLYSCVYSKRAQLAPNYCK